MAQGVITEIGCKKLCRSHAGDQTLPAITQMAFGSGGVDADGNVIEPTGTERRHLRRNCLRRISAATAIRMIRRPPADTRYVWVKRSWLIRIYPNRDYLIQTVT